MPPNFNDRCQGTVERFQLEGNRGWIVGNNDGLIYNFSFSSLSIDAMSVINVGSVVEFSAISKFNEAPTALNIQVLTADNRYMDIVGRVVKFDCAKAYGFISHSSGQLYAFRAAAVGNSTDIDAMNSEPTVLFDLTKDFSVPESVSFNITNVRVMHAARVVDASESTSAISTGNERVEHTSHAKQARKQRRAKAKARERDRSLGRKSSTKNGAPGGEWELVLNNKRNRWGNSQGANSGSQGRAGARPFPPPVNAYAQAA
jgi:cold shock CspA family protein